MCRNHRLGSLDVLMARFCLQLASNLGWWLKAGTLWARLGLVPCGKLERFGGQGIRAENCAEERFHAERWLGASGGIRC
jgi:hypothetical protein